MKPLTLSGFLLRVTAGLLTLFGIVAALGISAGTLTTKMYPQPLPHRAQWESYDQEQLKKSDAGCPSSVFVAPGGELVQCQLVFRFQIKPEQAPQEFPTAEEAAIFGFTEIAKKPTSLYYEWGGVIVKYPSGKFSALPANTSFAGDNVMIEGGSSFGLNAETVAHYHTHPCLPLHEVEFFSPPDLQEAMFGRHLVFMGDFCSGNVHEFKPGDKTDSEPAHDGGLWLTKGRIIGQFTEPHKMTVAD